MCRICMNLVLTVVETLENEGYIRNVKPNDEGITFSVPSHNNCILKVILPEDQDDLARLYEFLVNGNNIKEANLNEYVRNNPKLHKVMVNNLIKDKIISVEGFLNESNQEESHFSNDLPKELQELIEAFGADKVTVIKL